MQIVSVRGLSLYELEPDTALKTETVTKLAQNVNIIKFTCYFPSLTEDKQSEKL